MTNARRDVEKKPAVAYSVKKEKMYRAFSRVQIDRLGDYRINWFCEARRELTGPYEQLLEENRKGSLCQKALAECFTVNELKILEDYLWKTYSWGLSRSKFAILTSKRALEMDVAGELSAVYFADELRYVKLSSQKSYNLPFNVSGYGYMI